MSGKVCREVRREIDQSEVGQSLSANAEAHMAACPACAEFRAQRSRLRELVGALTPVTAPADFDMRLRARIARERDVRQQPFIFRFVMGTPGIVMAAGLVLLVGTVVFISQRSPQSPSLASDSGKNHVLTPAPSSVVATTDHPASEVPPATPKQLNQEKPKQSPLVARNTSRVTAPANAVEQVDELNARGAPSFRATGRAGEVSLIAPFKPMVVTMYDEHGATKKIQLPPISFGSQRLTDNRVPVSTTNARDW